MKWGKIFLLVVLVLMLCLFAAPAAAATEGEPSVDAATTPTAVDFEIPDLFMDGPIYYALQQANMKDENYSEAQIYVQLFAMVQKNWEQSHKYATTKMTES